MVRINLLPVRFSKKKEAGKQQLALFVVLLIAGFVGNFLWSSSVHTDLKTHQKRLQKTKADIESLDRIIGEVKSIRAKQQAVQEKLNVLDQLKQGRSGPVRMLDELSSLIPKRVWIRKLTQKAAGIGFEGSAVSIEDVSAFMSGLKQSKHFTAVELKRTTAVELRRTDGGAGSVRVVEFAIDAQVQFGAPPATTAAASKPAGG